MSYFPDVISWNQIIYSNIQIYICIISIAFVFAPSTRNLLLHYWTRMTSVSIILNFASQNFEFRMVMVWYVWCKWFLKHHNIYFKQRQRWKHFMNHKTVQCAQSSFCRQFCVAVYYAPVEHVTCYLEHSVTNLSQKFQMFKILTVVRFTTHT